MTTGKCDTVSRKNINYLSSLMTSEHNESCKSEFSIQNKLGIWSHHIFGHGCELWIEKEIENDQFRALLVRSFDWFALARLPRCCLPQWTIKCIKRTYQSIHLHSIEFHVQLYWPACLWEGIHNKFNFLHFNCCCCWWCELDFSSLIYLYWS